MRHSDIMNGDHENRIRRIERLTYMLAGAHAVEITLLGALVCLA